MTTSRRPGFIAPLQNGKEPDRGWQGTILSHRPAGAKLSPEELAKKTGGGQQREPSAALGSFRTVSIYHDGPRRAANLQTSKGLRQLRAVRGLEESRRKGDKRQFTCAANSAGADLGTPTMRRVPAGPGTRGSGPPAALWNNKNNSQPGP